MESRSNRYVQRETRKRNAYAEHVPVVNKKKQKSEQLEKVSDVTDKPDVSTKRLTAGNKKLKSKFEKVSDITDKPDVSTKRLTAGNKKLKSKFEKVSDITDKPDVSVMPLTAGKKKKLKSEQFEKNREGKDKPVVISENYSEPVSASNTSATAKTKMAAREGNESDTKNRKQNTKAGKEMSSCTKPKHESKEINTVIGKKLGEKAKNKSQVKKESAESCITLTSQSDINKNPLKKTQTRMKGLTRKQGGETEGKIADVKKTKTNRGVKKGVSQEQKEVDLKEVVLKEVVQVTDEVKNEGCVVKTKNKCHDCSMYVGAHVSVQGGVHKAVLEAVQIGASSFGLFLRNQRQWNAKPLEEDVALKFRAACIEHGFAPNMILPHASYLMNLGSPDLEKLQKSRDLFIDELHRCETLGLTLYNFHPGSTCGETSVEQCLQTIAESIDIGHSQTKYVITVLENMSCQGNTVGGMFEELRGIIDKVKDKSRVGVCLDTCHAFAAGFDLSTKEGFKQFVKSFSEIVGAKYLKALHINDSVGVRGSHRDLHENIGRGKIGLQGFSYVMNEPMFRHLPMILETPAGLGDDDEIRLLHSLCNKQQQITDK